MHWTLENKQLNFQDWAWLNDQGREEMQLNGWCWKHQWRHTGSPVQGYKYNTKFFLNVKRARNQIHSDAEFFITLKHILVYDIKWFQICALQMPIGSCSSGKRNREVRQQSRNQTLIRFCSMSSPRARVTAVSWRGRKEESNSLWIMIKNSLHLPRYRNRLAWILRKASTRNLADGL